MAEKYQVVVNYEGVGMLIEVDDIETASLLLDRGVVWFCLLAHPQINNSTYFSENALLPGLVKSSFHEDRLARLYNEELNDEMQKHTHSIPTAWLTAKFRQIGLDTYVHNFSLRSPLNPNGVYFGKNVYGILRAPRASSTEALVLSTAYRPKSSVHPNTAPSIAIMLAFAKFAIKEKYWAKDIIFLVTEHEQLGIQAWLEAYHDVTCGDENVLNHGDLKGHAGSIQAAVNLELHTIKIGHIDVKIEGLNGQLPNLDLFNLVVKMCVKEGVYYTFKNKAAEHYRGLYNQYKFYFKNLLNMVATQASGIPNGNHGLFLRFGIQAVTLEGFEQTHKEGYRVGPLGMGRIIEGTFRSMNNLLERFHQSFFFYLLPSVDRYVSIGLYISSICLIAAALIIKSCAKWCKLQEDLSNQKETETKGKPRNDILPIKCEYLTVIIIFSAMHLFGIALLNIPTLVASYYSPEWMYSVEECVFFGIVAACVLSFFFPFGLGSLRSCEGSLNVLCSMALLELGTALIAISMNNFSLGIVCGVISVPFALYVNPAKCKYYAHSQKLVWLLVHPLTVLYLLVVCNTLSMFYNEGWKEIVTKALIALQEAVIYGIVDSMIYGNWLFTVVTTVLIPNWLCFWCITFSNIKRRPKIDIDSQKKIN